MVRSAFSLVEVIVAMALLSVALLGVAASGLLAGELLRAAEVREDMVNRASRLLDSLVVHEVVGSGSLTGTRYRLDWSAGQDTVTVIARLPRHADFMIRALR